LRNPDYSINGGNSVMTSDIGNLTVATEGCSYAGNTGKLYVEYDIEFFDRKIPAPLTSYLPPFSGSIANSFSYPTGGGTGIFENPAVLEQNSLPNATVSFSTSTPRSISIINKDPLNVRTFEVFSYYIPNNLATLFLTTNININSVVGGVQVFAYANATESAMSSQPGILADPLSNSLANMHIVQVQIQPNTSCIITFTINLVTSVGGYTVYNRVMVVSPTDFSKKKPSLEDLSTLCLDLQKRLKVAESKFVDSDCEDEKGVAAECHRCHRVSVNICDVLGKIYCHKCLSDIDDTPRLIRSDELPPLSVTIGSNKKK